jgi:putative ABC transport system ATP-binding protein
MLKLINIKKYFGDRAILRGLSLETKAGELTILEGENGAGKSTLFNVMTGHLPHDDGHIMLNGIDLGPMPIRARAQYLAVLHQDPKLSSALSLSVYENCALAVLKDRRASFSPVKNHDTKVKILNHLEQLGLTYPLELPINLLSGGQRQLLAFAMATLHKPHLLLLDEPTAALDKQSSHLLMKLIKGFIHEWRIPAVMISHDHKLNHQYGDNLLLLKEGLTASDNLDLITK